MIHFKNDYSSFREGEKRLKAAKNGIPDRVPIYAQMHEFAMKELGVNAKEFYTSPELLAIGHLEVMERYGFDVPNLDYDDYTIEAEALGQKIIFSDTKVPEVDSTQPLIVDQTDLEKIRTPDYSSEGRFQHVIKIHKLFRELTGSTEPALRFCAPFTLTSLLRGITNLLMDIMFNPGFAKKLLDRIIEQVLGPWILFLNDEFPNAPAFYGADAMASLPIVNLDILKNWVIPSIARLRELCGPKICVPNWVGEHHLKNPEEMLDLKYQACPQFIEGQDPDVEILGPEIYKAYAEKHDIPLVLGIGSAFLDQSDSQEIEKRIKYYLEVGGKNGRFIMLLCNLSAETPPENVRAAIKIIKTYGLYE